MAFCTIPLLCPPCPLNLFPKQAETVLKAFCAHASQRISQLEQDLASMKEFRGLLKEAQIQLVI